MEFMLKGAGLWNIITRVETPPTRPAPTANPIPAAGPSRITPASVSNEVAVADAASLESFNAAELQYQTRCHLAASYIYCTLTLEARQHSAGAKELRRMWDTLRQRLSTLLRDIGTSYNPHPHSIP